MTLSVDVAPEPVDLELLARRALRLSRERVHMTPGEFADTLNESTCFAPGFRRFHRAWVEDSERQGPVYVDLRMFLLGLRLAGLDLLATIEEWTEDPSVEEAIERPYGQQSIPDAFAEMFAESVRPLAVEDLCRIALVTGRRRVRLTMTAVAAAVGSELPGSHPKPTKTSISRMEADGSLRTLDVLAMLRLYGLDLPAIIARWIETGYRGRVAR